MTTLRARWSRCTSTRRLGLEAFSREPSPESARYWYQFVTTMPGYRPEQLRGAFRNGEQVGSYFLHERTMHVGTARLLTGCIGAVVTYPDHRHQGVATALMQDAIDYAQSHDYPLLLLDGIPKFYDRYGYDDVFDVSVQDIDRAAVLAQPPSPLHLRPVTLEDAEHIVTLYNRHFGPLTGSFTRTVEWQHHRLQYRSADNPLWLAVDAAGRPQGYLALQGGAERFQAQELAADTWAAALALLQHHAHLLEGARCSHRAPLSYPSQRSNLVRDDRCLASTGYLTLAASARRVGHSQPDLSPSLCGLDGTTGEPAGVGTGTAP